MALKVELKHLKAKQGQSEVNIANIEPYIVLII